MLSFEEKFFLVTVKLTSSGSRQQGFYKNMVRRFSKAHGPYIEKKK